ncbi:MAG TPA: hypothetical protein VJ276_25540 [Thermoanaerobaculia bacterium]|nr:hypothetical protein [Thermoanaerobaculia bacterium]
MKNVVVIAALVSFAACDPAGGERPLIATCRPAVTVLFPAAKPASVKAPSAPQAGEVVQVYWDVSRSMHDFSVTRRAEELTDDLAPVVAALDSGVLLQAHAASIEHYGVGETIVPLPSARAALHPAAKRTALHLAAEQIGGALANGAAQAALVVSDMEVDAVPRTSAGDATVCGNVPLPSTGQAGPLFGRCFESAVLASGASRTRASLLAHVFRKRSHGRELFILLLATDRAFGTRISNEIARRLDFTRHVIFDSGSVSAGNVAGCRMALFSEDMNRSRTTCGVKCFDPELAIQAECDVRRDAMNAWIEPVGQGGDGVSYESVPKKRGDREQQAVVRFAVPCSARAGRFQATVPYSWRQQTPWSADRADPFAQRPSVRDLFDSLADAIVRTVAPPRLRIGIDLVK